MTLTVLSAGPGVTLQDAGRPGQTAAGLSRGGAADRLALLEAQALLGATAADGVLECAGMGGQFRVAAPTRFAVTGAAADLSVDGAALDSFATHLLEPGQTLNLGAVTGGVYAYLCFAGGVLARQCMGARGTHLLAGLGRPLAAGDALQLGPDPNPAARAMRLTPERASRGPIRLMPGPQTALFTPDTRARFEATAFVRSPRANRQGVRMDHDGAGFATAGQLALVSDFISEGDVQMTGDGRPFVLMSEHQTTGGYPRIGTVLPADMPRVAQMTPGTSLTFSFVDLTAAQDTFVSQDTWKTRLASRTVPLVRDPRDLNLAEFNLIDGVTSAGD